MALAARTRQRLTKYNVLQLRMLDLYTLKRVQLNPVHIKMNKKLQKGHPRLYENILRAEGKDEEADRFAIQGKIMAEETRDAMDEMRAYVSQNVHNPTDMG